MTKKISFYLTGCVVSCFLSMQSFAQELSVIKCGEVSIEYVCEKAIEDWVVPLCESGKVKILSDGKNIILDLPKELPKEISAQSASCMRDSSKLSHYISVYFWGGGNSNEFYYLYDVNGNILNHNDPLFIQDENKRSTANNEQYFDLIKEKKLEEVEHDS